MDITATEAKQRFGDVVMAAVSGRRVNITKNGKAALAVVTAERMDELERRERVAFDLAGQETAGEPWPPPPE